MIKSGVTVFAAPDDDLAQQQAREYMERQGLTKDDVKMIRSETSICLVTKREVWVGETGDKYISADTA